MISAFFSVSISKNVPRQTTRKPFHADDDEVSTGSESEMIKVRVHAMLINHEGPDSRGYYISGELSCPKKHQQFADIYIYEGAQLSDLVDYIEEVFIDIITKNGGVTKRNGRLPKGKLQIIQDIKHQLPKTFDVDEKTRNMTLMELGIKSGEMLRAKYWCKQPILPISYLKDSSATEWIGPIEGSV